VLDFSLILHRPSRIAGAARKILAPIYLRLIAGDWVRDFLDEAESWPAGRHKDQIDATAAAFNRLVAETAYNTSYRWL